MWLNEFNSFIKIVDSLLHIGKNCKNIKCVTFYLTYILTNTMPYFIFKPMNGSDGLVGLQNLGNTVSLKTTFMTVDTKLWINGSKEYGLLGA